MHHAHGFAVLAVAGDVVCRVFCLGDINIACNVLGLNMLRAARYNTRAKLTQRPTLMKHDAQLKLYYIT